LQTTLCKQRFLFTILKHFIIFQIENAFVTSFILLMNVYIYNFRQKLEGKDYVELMAHLSLHHIRQN